MENVTEVKKEKKTKVAKDGVTPKRKPKKPAPTIDDLILELKTIISELDEEMEMIRKESEEARIKLTELESIKNTGTDQ